MLHNMALMGNDALKNMHIQGAKQDTHHIATHSPTNCAPGSFAQLCTINRILSRQCLCTSRYDSMCTLMKYLPPATASAHCQAHQIRHTAALFCGSSHNGVHLLLILTSTGCCLPLGTVREVEVIVPFQSTLPRPSSEVESTTTQIHSIQ